MIAALIAEELARLGVTNWCLAPGSRSTPLVLAAARHPQIRLHPHFEERGLGFFALGLAQSTLAPVAIVVTSGTALANLFPAVIEAYAQGIPLIILSADRPFELLDCGANQAIHQDRIFGDYTRFFSSISDPTIPPESVLTTVDQAVLSASEGPGPVHLNLGFREPLTFTPIPNDILPGWQTQTAAYSQCVAPKAVGSLPVLSPLPAIYRPVIVIGQLRPADQDRVAAFLAGSLAEFSLPIVADIGAGGLGGMTLDERHLSRLSEADGVIHIGGSFVSNAMQTFLTPFRDSGRSLHFQTTTQRQDPLHLGGVRISPPWDATSIAQVLQACGSWPADVLAALSAPFPALPDTAFAEPQIAAHLGAHLPGHLPLFVGNSLPIRAMNRWGHRHALHRVYTNRGASGIDGLIGTFAGLSLGHPQGILGVIGDVSALHDLPSLALLSHSQTPAVLIVINNSGGGIFQHLPVGDTPEGDPLFRMPHSFTLAGAADLFGLTYHAISAPDALSETLQEALNKPMATIIEICCGDTHKAYQEALQCL